MSTDPRQALAELLGRVAPVGVETCAADDPAALAGRVLAEPVALDRDSPALDVSAMDGFAVRLDELRAGALPVEGECRIGQPPAELSCGAARRIFTGSPLPIGADTVVRLERGDAADGVLRLLPGVEIEPGADIRPRGENARAGAGVLPAGCRLTAAALAALAAIGPAEVRLFRRLRVAVVTTGDELVRGPGPVPVWRLRDSNGPSLAAMLSPASWIESVDLRQGRDELALLQATIEDTLASADAVVLTGGVSKGDHDLVRPAIERAGGEVVFHRLNARPGRPTLGATRGGKPIVGLPGNPLAVLCAGRRLLVPVLRCLAGFTEPDPPAPRVTLAAWSGGVQALAWYRPVRLTGGGVAELASLRGSGDMIGPATSDGFVEVPPGADGSGPYDYYPWTV